MIESFNSYEALFACEELDNGIREYIMSVADEFKYGSYCYGKDYEEKYVQVHSYYTKKGELIATIEREEGEYLLKEFNKRVVSDWEKENIQKKVKELNDKRIDEIGKVFGYLEKNNMSYELKRTLKRDCFKVSINEEKDMFGCGVIVVQMKDRKSNIMYMCTFYEGIKSYEKSIEASTLTPWEDDCDGKILYTPRCLVVGVAGELREYFSTALLKGKGERKYKYAVSKIEKWYIKEAKLTLHALRREKKVKLGWFGL